MIAPRSEAVLIKIKCHGAVPGLTSATASAESPPFRDPIGAAENVEDYFALRMGMAALARTPALAEASLVGALSAQSGPPRLGFDPRDVCPGARRSARRLVRARPSAARGAALGLRTEPTEPRYLFVASSAQQRKERNATKTAFQKIKNVWLAHRDKCTAERAGRMTLSANRGRTTCARLPAIAEGLQ
jgi:hypothetical protein